MRCRCGCPDRKMGTGSSADSRPGVSRPATPLGSRSHGSTSRRNSSPTAQAPSKAAPATRSSLARPSWKTHLASSYRRSLYSPKCSSSNWIRGSPVGRQCADYKGFSSKKSTALAATSRVHQSTPPPARLKLSPTRIARSRTATTRSRASVLMCLGPSASWAATSFDPSNTRALARSAPSLAAAVRYEAGCAPRLR